MFGLAKNIHSKTYENCQKRMIRASAKRKTLINRGLSRGSNIHLDSELNIRKIIHLYKW
jgi:hypothetical protein